MAWTCPDCGTEGTVTDVGDGGRCWRCSTPVKWSHGPVSNLVTATTIAKLEQFNRRAVVALRGCALNGWDTGFIASIAGAVERYDTLPDGQQKNLLRCVLRHGGTIADKAVVDYAADHAPKVTS